MFYLQLILIVFISILFTKLLFNIHKINKSLKFILFDTIVMTLFYIFIIISIMYYMKISYTINTFIEFIYIAFTIILVPYLYIRLKKYYIIREKKEIWVYFTFNEIVQIFISIFFQYLLFTFIKLI